MDIIQAIQNRHSVRQYTNTPIAPMTVQKLRDRINQINESENLHFQLITNEPKAFSSQMAKYGKFENVRNYFVLIGKKSDGTLDEKIGYYGEELVLLAQQNGLNTCWVGLTYKKIPEKIEIEHDEKIVCVIAVGHGATQGVEHKIKPVEKICREYTSMPEWFRKGIDCVQLAPTAVNQQKFSFSFDGTQVKLKPGFGFYTRVDAGIAKYHFEVGAGSHNINWAE